MVRYTQNQVVHGVGFEVNEGEFLTLLGPSGCGKTTTLRCIAGLEQPTSGRIEIDGVVVSDPARQIRVASEERRIGMVFQSYAIWPHMTVFHNVAFPLQMRRMPKAEVRERVMRVLELLGLSGLADRSATMLSGGQQQRVALARALAPEPRLVLLDEPLSNLDAKLRERTRYELKRLQQQLGITTVYVTHDQEEALELSDRVVVMREGRVIQNDGPRGIYDQPADPFVAAFVGQANFISGRLQFGADGWRLVTPDGASIPVDSSPALEPGEWSLVLRPHKVDLHAYDGGAASPHLFEGRLLRQVYLGERSDCWVQVKGIGELRVHGPANLEAAEGDLVRVSLDPGRGRLMRNQTDQAVGR